MKNKKNIRNVAILIILLAALSFFEKTASNHKKLSRSAEEIAYSHNGSSSFPESVQPGRAMGKSIKTSNNDLESILAGPPQGIKDWLDGIDSSQRNTELNKIALLAQASIRAISDYSMASKIVPILPRSEQEFFLRTWVFGTRGSLGVAVDYREQLKLADLADNRDRMRAIFFRKFGESRGREIIAAGLPKLHERDIEAFALGSIRQGVEVAFSAIDYAIDTSSRNAAIDIMTNDGLDRDPIAYSRYVSNMQDGADRDRAIESMIKWLSAKGDITSAEMWKRELNRN